MICKSKFALCYCSLGEQSIYSMWNTVSVIRLSTVDCCSTGENKEVVRDMGRKRESNSCLRRSSEVLGPSSPGAAVQDTNLVVRDNLERRASFEGNLAPLSAGEQDNFILFILQPFCYDTALISPLFKTEYNCVIGKRHSCL